MNTETVVMWNTNKAHVFRPKLVKELFLFSSEDGGSSVQLNITDLPPNE